LLVVFFWLYAPFCTANTKKRKTKKEVWMVAILAVSIAEVGEGTLDTKETTAKTASASLI
jgi:hypothetical protein